MLPLGAKYLVLKGIRKIVELLTRVWAQSNFLSFRTERSNEFLRRDKIDGKFKKGIIVAN